MSRTRTPSARDLMSVPKVPAPTPEQQRERAELRARLDAQQDAEHAAVAALLPVARQVAAAFGGRVDTRFGAEVDPFQPRLWIYFGGDAIEHTAELVVEIDRSAPLLERAGKPPVLVAHTKTSSFSGDLDAASAWADALSGAVQCGRVLLSIARGEV